MYLEDVLALSFYLGRKAATFCAIAGNKRFAAPLEVDAPILRVEDSLLGVACAKRPVFDVRSICFQPGDGVEFDGVKSKIRARRWRLKRRMNRDAACYENQNEYVENARHLNQNSIDRAILAGT